MHIEMFKWLKNWPGVTTWNFFLCSQIFSFFTISKHFSYDGDDDDCDMTTMKTTTTTTTMMMIWRRWRQRRWWWWYENDDDDCDMTTMKTTTTTMVMIWRWWYDDDEDDNNDNMKTTTMMMMMMMMTKILRVKILKMFLKTVACPAHVECGVLASFFSNKLRNASECLWKSG